MIKGSGILVTRIDGAVMKKMSFHIGPVLDNCMAILCALIFAGCQVTNDSPRLDTGRLVEIAVRHELPLPTKGCKLVLAHDGGGSNYLNGERAPSHYLPAYLLEEYADGSALMLVGCERIKVKPPFSGEPVWHPFEACEREDTSDSRWQACFGHPNSFACAVQTAATGDHKTAQVIWRRFLEEIDSQWHESIDGIEVTQITNCQDQFLAASLYSNLVRTLTQAPSAWDQVFSKMGRLFYEYPSLKKGIRERLYNDLQTTVTNLPPQAGSVEELLVRWSKYPTKAGRLKLFGCRCCERGVEDDPARQIVCRGYAAMPELIGLLADHRITAHYYSGDGYYPDSIQRLGDLACELAQQMAGGKTVIPQRGDRGAALREWWKQRQGQDEFVLLKRAVFCRVGETITGVNKYPSLILAKKYPQKMGDLCEEYERGRSTNEFDSAITDMLVASDLPRIEVVKKLKEFAGRGSLGNRLGVLQELARVDEAACAKILLPLIRSLPSDIQGGEYWTCEEARVSHVVMELDNEEVWREFQSVAKRCSIGLRMEMMNPLSYTYIGNRNRSHRLAFLSAFLDDEGSRVMSGDKRFDGPCAGFTIDRLSVRDFAATQIASILGIAGVPDGSWNTSQWAEYRRKVKANLGKAGAD